MRNHGLKVNPLKCALCISFDEFLGFIVREKEIGIDKNKANAIIETSPSKYLKELQILFGEINFLSRFISNHKDFT